MHIITPHAVRFLVLNRDREQWTFNTLEDAFVSTRKALRKGRYPLYLWQSAIGDAFDRDTEFNPAKILFVIQTDLGDPVTISELERVDRAIVERNARRRPRGDFRNGAWPAIGCRRGHRGSSYRLVATKNERTWTNADDDQMIEIGMVPKCAGRKRDLPNSWDDIPRGRQRSWKAYRANQWR